MAKRRILTGSAHAIKRRKQRKCLYKGFIRRQLLKPRQGGNYAAIVEHESYATFQAMHASPSQAEASTRVQPLFDGEPKPEFYEVLID